MKYTVILMYPDYMSDGGSAHESWCGCVEARDPVDAVRQARQEIDCDELNDINDLLPLSVFEGDQKDLIGHWAAATPDQQEANAEWCSGVGCDELVKLGADYYASPCGTFCPEHMAEHVKSCGVCAKEFDLAFVCDRCGVPLTVGNDTDCCLDRQACNVRAGTCKPIKPLTH